jgi:hypothetical protein
VRKLRVFSYCGVCVSYFSCCDRIFDIKNLKRGKIYFGSGFQRVQSIVAFPHIRGQNATVVGRCDRRDCSTHCGQEAERGVKVMDKIQSLMTCPQLTYFL